MVRVPSLQIYGHLDVYVKVEIARFYYGKID